VVEAEVVLQLVHTCLEVAHRQLHLRYHAVHLLQPERLVLQLGGYARAPVKLLDPLLELPQPRDKAPQVYLQHKAAPTILGPKQYHYSHKYHHRKDVNLLKTASPPSEVRLQMYLNFQK
jgi:hypothetical protein